MVYNLIRYVIQTLKTDGRARLGYHTWPEQTINGKEKKQILNPTCAKFKVL